MSCNYTKHANIDIRILDPNTAQIWTCRSASSSRMASHILYQATVPQVCGFRRVSNLNNTRHYTCQSVPFQQTSFRIIFLFSLPNDRVFRERREDCHLHTVAPKSSLIVDFSLHAPIPNIFTQHQCLISLSHQGLEFLHHIKDQTSPNILTLNNVALSKCELYTMLRHMAAACGPSPKTPTYAALSRCT